MLQLETEMRGVGRATATSDLAALLLAIGVAGCSAQGASGDGRPSGQGGANGGSSATGGTGWGGTGLAGSAQGGSAQGGSAGSAGNAGNAGSAGSAGSAGNTAYDAGGNVAVTRYSAQVGPFSVPSGTEFTVCSTQRLANPESVFVGHMAAALGEGSHHMIVYRSSATQEAPALVPCQPFEGIMSGEVPIMIVQIDNDDLFFPQNVGLQFEAGQMIKLEVHYINTTVDPIDVSGTMHFDTVPLTTPNFVASDLAFWGPVTLVIPPGAAQTPVLFQQGKPNTFGFAATTHQHRFGTRFRIWHSQSQSDPNPALLIDNTNWDEPPLYPLNPILEFNGTNGLSFQCDWNNTSTQLVTFGESALQEMCFLWMYYYPADGFDIRFM